MLDISINNRNVFSAILNVFYIAAAAWFFFWNFKAVKRKGLLTKVGE
ncbi:MAG: hypothetical protein V3W31_03755 [Thermodesulfobacteriota bacterium]